MLISKEKKTELIEKLSREPDFRAISLTAEGTLKIDAVSGSTLIENFILILDNAVYAGNGFSRFPESEGSAPIAVCCFTGKKMLLFDSEQGAEYITSKKKAQSGTRFALALELRDSSMLFYVNGSVSGSLFKSLYAEKEFVFAIIQDIAKSWVPDMASGLHSFFNEKGEAL